MPTRSRPGPVPFPVPSPRWELALAQLAALPESELDQLARRWLTALGGHAVGRDLRAAPYLAYEAFLGEPPLAVPLRARLYRRRQQLQPHHVEAFVGHLVRTGGSAGILATTGPVSKEAQQAADDAGIPRVRLLSGPEWLRELAFHRIGITFHTVPVWLLRSNASSGHDPSSRRRN